jgi:hypothetical protein
MRLPSGMNTPWHKSEHGLSSAQAGRVILTASDLLRSHWLTLESRSGEYCDRFLLLAAGGRVLGYPHAGLFEQNPVPERFAPQALAQGDQLLLMAVGGLIDHRHSRRRALRRLSAGAALARIGGLRSLFVVWQEPGAAVERLKGR